MSLLQTVRNLFRASPAADLAGDMGGSVVRAKYDAAQTTNHNSNHWANADHLSANAANSPAVSKTLRSRCRYEYANNTYAQGMAQTVANDTIGTGPRLQLLTTNDAANRFVERLWLQWSTATCFASKLRTLRTARFHDGAGLGVKIFNPRLNHPVQLDLKVYEIDRLTTPDLYGPTANAVDGIKFDNWGNPSEYHILKQHPGDNSPIGGLPSEYDRIPASQVIHWFKALRPEQQRGVPEITPALELFAQLRRYTLAVLGAAETAADMAAVMKTNVNDLTPIKIKAMQYLPIEARQMLTMPEGWDISQFKPNQPTNTYAEFKRELINEIARVLNMPYNVAAGNSSGYNYASGRLDDQWWLKAIQIDRNDCEVRVLSSLLMDFLTELSLQNLLPDVQATVSCCPQISGLAPAIAHLQRQNHVTAARWMRGDADVFPTLNQVVLARRDLLRAGFADLAELVLDLPTAWHWDGREHVDPAKEANGQRTRITSGTTGRQREYSRAGIDMDTADESAARGYGVSVEEYRRRLFDQHFPPPAPVAEQPAPAPTSDDDTDDDVQAMADAFDEATLDVQTEVAALLNL